MDFSEQLEARLASIESKLIAGKNVLTVNEVLAFTGISKSYLYKLTGAGIIPCYRPLGKLLFFNRAEIETWLQSRAVPTSQDLGQQAANYLTLEHRRGKPKTKGARNNSSP